MIIYNVTVNIEESLSAKWKKWMQEEHIPEVLATGKFTSARLMRVRVVEEMGGETYAVQYVAKDMDTLQSYYMEDAPALREKGIAMFGDKMLAFRTELELISEH
jgi:hypothetical protein